MSTHDLSFIQKRGDRSISDIPAGGIAGVVVGIILIVLISIWCCCPCWKNQQPILSKEENYKEDVGNERGVSLDTLEPQQMGNITATANTSAGSMRNVPIVNPVMPGVHTRHNYFNSTYSAIGNMEVPEADGKGRGGRFNELDGTPGLQRPAVMDTRSTTSSPPSYDQISPPTIAVPESIMQSQKKT